LKVWNNK